MRFIGHLWTAFKNLLAIVVLLGMYSVATTDFETVVVSGLALIHGSVVWAGVGLARANIEQSQYFVALFVRVLRLLKDPEIGLFCCFRGWLTDPHRG